MIPLGGTHDLYPPPPRNTGPTFGLQEFSHAHSSPGSG